MRVQPSLSLGNPLEDFGRVAPFVGVKIKAISLSKIATSVMPGAFPHNAR